MEKEMNDMTDRLAEICGQKNVLLDEPMKRHTTFGTGGNVKAAVTPLNTEQLKKVLKLLGNEAVVLGNGSNVLFKDGDTDGIVVITKQISRMFIKDGGIFAEAGAMMSALAAFALEKSFAGMEFMSGIPGTVGGGIYMNAGAYGGTIEDVVEYVCCITPEGEEEIFYKKDLNLGYRHSVFMENSYIITGAFFTPVKGDKEEIAEKMNEFNRRRREKQPLEYRSAGSTFKRPVGYFAGKLIEDSGLKGYRVGDAQVSEKHAGFVINRGNATANDIISVINHCKETVKEKFGVELETEIKILGND